MMSIENYKAAKEKINSLLDEARETARAAFREGANGIFAKFPGLQQFTWTQYTPYFNDGDTCHFSVDRDYFNVIFKGIDYHIDCYGNSALIHDVTNGGEIEDSHEDCQTLKSVGEAISDLLCVFEDRDFMDMFDDHVSVTVTADDIQVDTYDHD